MDRFQSTIAIDASPSVCYERWHHFEKFPSFMNHIKAVTKTDDQHWRWTIEGPLGTEISWEAEIDVDEPNKLISWHSVPESKVDIQNIVLFEAISSDQTEVTCAIEYHLEHGGIQEAMAQWLTQPHKLVKENLEHFKHVVEKINLPAEKARTGKVIQLESEQPLDYSQTQGTSPDNALNTAAVYSESQSKKKGTTNMEEPRHLHSLEEHKNLELASIDLDEIETAELDEVDLQELQALKDEETPYLGLEGGALYVEDLIEMRSDELLNAEEADVYTNSMDVAGEDLESFTENLDTEIDVGMGPRDFIYAKETEEDSEISGDTLGRNASSRDE